MADAAWVSELSEAFELLALAQTSGSLLKDAVKDAVKDALSENGSSLLAKFEGYAKKRAVLSDNEVPSLEEEKGVYSPIMSALEDLYTSPSPGCVPGRTYVMYAPYCQGKTTGAVEFLKNCLPQFTDQEGRDLPQAHGIMITGSPGSNYFRFMSDRLGTEGCKDWIFSLIASLLPDPSVPGRLPSILILDAFNTASAINEEFVEKFFHATINKGFYTVILSQDEAFASRLCAKNNGKKICALPAAYDIGTPMHPQWNQLRWGRELLCKMIKKRFNKPGDHDRIDVDENGMIPWVQDEFTPQEAIWGAERRLYSPPSPRRIRSRYE